MLLAVLTASWCSFTFVLRDGVKEAGKSPARSRHCVPVTVSGAGQSDTSPVTSPVQSGRTILKEAFVSSITAPGCTPVPRVRLSPQALSKGRLALLLGIVVFLAVAIYYFVGVDEGMVSLFGKTMVIHEWVHDSRHFLGFPCH
jgi:hypothetical protein